MKDMRIGVVHFPGTSIGVTRGLCTFPGLTESVTRVRSDFTWANLSEVVPIFGGARVKVVQRGWCQCVGEGPEGMQLGCYQICGGGTRVYICIF